VRVKIAVYLRIDRDARPFGEARYSMLAEPE